MRLSRSGAGCASPGGEERQKVRSGNSLTRHVVRVIVRGRNCSRTLYAEGA